MESINIADRDMLFWAGSPNEFNDGNSNDFIVNEDVIVKYFKEVMAMYYIVILVMILLKVHYLYLVLVH